MSERTEEEINVAAYILKTEKQANYRDIAEKVGIALGRVGDAIKKGEVLVKAMQKGEALAGMQKGEALAGMPESEKTEKKKPQSMKDVQHVLSDESEGKLYFLAVGAGFNDVNDWIEQELVPWYAIKSKLESKIGGKFTPDTFLGTFNMIARDSVLFRQMAEQFNKEQVTPSTPSVQTPNKPEVKT